MPLKPATIHVPAYIDWDRRRSFRTRDESSCSKIIHRYCQGTSGCSFFEHHQRKHRSHLFSSIPNGASLEVIETITRTWLSDQLLSLCPKIYITILEKNQKRIINTATPHMLGRNIGYIAWMEITSRRPWLLGLCLMALSIKSSQVRGIRSLNRRSIWPIATNLGTLQWSTYSTS